MQNPIEAAGDEEIDAHCKKCWHLVPDIQTWLGRCSVSEMPHYFKEATYWVRLCHPQPEIEREVATPWQQSQSPTEHSFFFFSCLPFQYFWLYTIWFRATGFPVEVESKIAAKYPTRQEATLKAKNFLTKLALLPCLLIPVCWGLYIYIL
jgi:hypothetical protein